MIIKQLIVDLWQKILQPITVVQREASGRRLAITLTGGGLPVNLTGCDVIFYAQKPDETILFNDCVVKDAAAGQVEYTITEQTVVLAGTLKCWIVVIKAGATVRSQEFHITVQESPDFTAAVESTSEFSDLEVALATLAGFDARVTAAEGDISALDTRMGAAEGSISGLGGRLDTLEDDKTVAQNARARAYLSSNQENIPNATPTRVQLSAETYDPGGNFNTGTYKFVVPVSGYYLLKGQIMLGSMLANKLAIGSIYVDGTSVVDDYQHTGLASSISLNPSCVMYLNAGQYVELFGRHDAGVSTVTFLGNTRYTFLEVALMST